MTVPARAPRLPLRVWGLAACLLGILALTLLAALWLSDDPRALLAELLF